MALKDALKRLITRNVIITHIPGGRLKAYDVNKSQSIGSPTEYSNRIRWRTSKSFSTSRGYGFGSSLEEIEAMRRQMYLDYELMDTDALISSALDLYAEEASSKDFHTDQVLVIKSNDARLKKILHNLFYDILNIEFNLYSWMRTMFKYGDFMLYLQIAEKHGIVNAMPIHPSLMRREEGNDIDPNIVKFYYEGDYSIGRSPMQAFEAYEIAHFRLLGDTNFLPYGRSLLEGARKNYKASCLPGDAMIWTPNGYELMQDLQVNCPIFTYNVINKQIELSSIKNFVKNGTKEVFEITTSHRKFKATADHLILTSNGYVTVDKLNTDTDIVVANIKNFKVSNKIPDFSNIYEDVVCNFDHDYFKSDVKQESKKCRICGEQYNMLVWMHYKHKHGVSYEDYIKDYCGSPKYLKLLSQNRRILRQDALNVCLAFNLDSSKLKYYNANSTVEIISKSSIVDNFKEFVRFFGFLLGDGWFSSVKNPTACSFSLGVRLDKSTKYVDFLRNVGLNPKITMNGTSRAQCNVYNSHFCKLLSSLGFITGTKNKVVPKWVYDLDAEHILEFLYGFADADGCKINTKYQISGINKVLINDLKTLCQQIGIISTNITVSKSRGYKNSDNFVYSFVFDDRFISDSRLTKISNDHIVEKVKSIKYFDSVDVYDLETHSDNHNFVADGVVVHNCLLEDAMLLHRIMRAPERRMFFIDVGNIAPEEIDAHIESIVNETKRTPYIDPETGEYNFRFNLASQFEDVYLPVRGDKTGTKIETLPGLGNEGQLEDVKYLRQKTLAALKIPPAYLGFGEEGADTKASLSNVDVRFSKAIERNQTIFVSELYKMAVIHLYVQGFTSEDMLNFELQLTNPSLIFERQKIDILTAKVDLVKSIKEDNLFSDKYIYENIFGMTEEEWRREIDLIAETAQNKFRWQQITDEGNDPKVTGKSFGTPHDIATMQVASKFEAGSSNPESMKQLYTPDERENNEGKPDQYAGSFETRRDQDFGRDPVGRRESQKLEHYSKLLKGLENKRKVIKKPLTESYDNTDDIDMLREDNLIDDLD